MPASTVKIPHHNPLRLLNAEPNWKNELSDCVTSIDELLKKLDLCPTQINISHQTATQFALKVPQSFIARMEKGSPNDPLLKQVLPMAEELASPIGYSQDPLNETDHNPAPGIIHKYRHRLLLIVSPACAINCRYCFRRHFPYLENRQSKSQWSKTLDYISNNKDINEVIFSGGDPLAVNDNFLGWLTAQIANIQHIKRLRIHTRLPVVIPSRIDRQFLQWATSTRLRPIVVLHINHANEINTELKHATQLLVDAGLKVLNQTVLLKGINDDANTLANLSERLFECNITPYYLHLLDPVQGASHFDVDRNTALKIYRQLQAIVPGFLLPKLAQEIPGEPSKTLIN
ncbi:MAG: EF-P beta-lysylation protein EpmB [Porticoccaceae bacterium]|nr:EF-P beta-lysylation protein EpmB [Porticoccaceae bacterium]